MADLPAVTRYDKMDRLVKWTLARDPTDMLRVYTLNWIEGLEAEIERLKKELDERD